MPTFNDFLILLPEAYLTVAACVILLMDAFLKGGQRVAIHWLSIIVLLVGAWLVIDGQPATAVSGFSGMFIRDPVAEILKVFSLLTTALMFIYSRGYLRDRFPALANVEATTPLLQSGAVDSLGFLELMTFLSEEFGITLEDEDFDAANLETPGKLADFVERKL